MRALSLLLHDVFERDPSESGFSGPAADRYKLSVRELDAQLRGLSSVRRDAPILVPRRWPGRGTDTPFLLTVDDGGVSFYTRVADRLEALGWRAHCFVTTSCVGRAGFLDVRQIRELHRRGHVIGTHSVSHPTRFSACGWDEMVREWTESRRVLTDLLGEDVTVGSVPGGYFSPTVAAAAREAGLSVLFTSEPTTRVWTVCGCLVLGRFSLRRGHRPDFAARLGGMRTSTLWREWLVWNAKKRAKALLGSIYPRVTAGARPHAELAR